MKHQKIWSIIINQSNVNYSIENEIICTAEKISNLIVVITKMLTF